MWEAGRRELNENHMLSGFASVRFMKHNTTNRPKSEARICIYLSSFCLMFGQMQGKMWLFNYAQHFWLIICTVDEKSILLILPCFSKGLRMMCMAPLPPVSHTTTLISE